MLHTVRASARSAAWLPAVVAVLAPAVVLLVSVHRFTQSTLLDFRPFLNDEVYYWHQIATAAAVGTEGGYYTVEEQTPAVALFHFGPHGPVYPLLIGSIARMTGWHRASGPLFNLAWISICLAAFMRLARPELPRAWLIAILVATYWPLPFWAASNMQESFHHGVAILLAGAIVGIGRGMRVALLGGWVVLLLAMVIRPSWGVLLPGMCIVSFRQLTPARAMIACALSALVFAGVLVLYSSIVAPMPGAFEFLRLMRLDEGIAPPLTNARANLARLVNIGDDYDPLEIVHRVEYLALTLALVGAVVWHWRQRKSGDERVKLLVQASQLAGIVLAMILLYALTNWTEHRIISAHVLLAALVLTMLRGRLGPVLTMGLVVTNALSFAVYAESFRQNRSENFVWDRRPLRVFEETIDDRLRYHPGASPWCNTLLSAQYPPDFIAVPAGIGISITRSPDEFAGLPKSRYLLLDPPALEAFAGRISIEPIGPPLSYGRVYLNLDARCPQ